MGTVSTVLATKVTLRLRCVDRVLLGGYIPLLQTEFGVVRFLLDRGYRIPSPTGLATIHERLVDEINQYAAAHQIPVVHFERKARKEAVAAPYLKAAAAAGRDAVAMIGVAQERLPGGWRGTRTNRGSDEHPHFAYRRSVLWVNHYYFYVWDTNFGPGFVKMCPFAPYPVWVWVNGHEWLKQHLTRSQIPFTVLDNGIASSPDPVAVQDHADGLRAGHLQAFCGKWLSRLPSALTAADRSRGVDYRFSVRQVEISDTAVFARPRDGRRLFEAMIRDHLDVGRPEKVRLVVDRQVNSRTPGRFSTQLITTDVDPALQIHYKSSKIKAYFKAHRALRVETTINNPRDFAVRKTLTQDNWEELITTGTGINARMLHALGEGAPPPPDAATLEQVVLPSQNGDVRVPGLRLGDPRVMALLAALAHTSHAISGVTNAGMVRLMSGLLDTPYTARQAGYDLRRLRRKGLIIRQEHRNTYWITPLGRQLACYLTALTQRGLLPGLAALEHAQATLHAQQPPPSGIVGAWQRWERELDRFLAAVPLAA